MSVSAPSRRQLLIAALAAAGSALAGGGWWIAKERRERWRREASGWIHARDLDAARRIGEAYLALLPAADADALWSAIDDRLAPWPRTGLGDAAFRRRVRAAVESDYAREAVVRIEGYLFDETSAALCALMALSAREATSLPPAP